jgi:hypothetical protein
MAEAPARVDVPLHSDEELRTAWEKCRNERWPATFEETMTDSLRARMVEMVASGLAHKRPPATQPVGTLDEPVCRVHARQCDEVISSRRCANCPRRPPPRFTPPANFVDRKRLAGGDRDDD